MLRKIVGWSWHSGDNWETVMRIMKGKVANAMKQYYVRPWDMRIQTMRINNSSRLRSMDEGRWESLCLQWEPQRVQDNSQEYHAHRNRGRPLLRWKLTEVNEPVIPYDSPSLVPYEFQANQRVRNNSNVPFFLLGIDSWW